MSPETWLVWVNRVYFGAGAIAAFATAVTVVAGLKQSQLNDRISSRKDRELAEFQASAKSEGDIAALKIQEGAIRLAQLQKNIQWRTLSGHQATMLCEEIKKEQGDIHFEWIQNDPESQSLADSMAKIFEACGWTTTNMPTTPGPNTFFGLSIQERYNGPQASFMRQAFDKAGIQYRTDLPQYAGTPGPLSKTGDVRTLVGSKPPPQL